MAEKVSGVYRIEIGPYFYYGRSGDLKRRVAKHSRALRGGYHDNSWMQRAYDKYGQFDYVLVEECLPEESPCVEAKYLTENKDSPLCMNLASADVNGYFIHTAETRRRISEATRGKRRSLETRRRISEAQRGKVVSEETRRRISEANKGRKMPPEVVYRLAESRRKNGSMQRVSSHG